MRDAGERKLLASEAEETRKRIKARNARRERELGREVVEETAVEKPTRAFTAPMPSGKGGGEVSDMLVIYHGQCRDGFCAAWVASKRFPHAEFRPTAYGTEPPDVTGRDVLMVDFAFSREQVLRMEDQASRIRVLDHHKTAQAALAGLEFAVFDMERSGAGITWDELMDPLPRPWIVNYVEDRDLWTWKLPQSREVNAYISTLPYGHAEDFGAWTDAALLTKDSAEEAGRVALQAICRYAEAVCENARPRKVGAHTVPSVNAPQHDISEVLEHLLDLNPGAPFVHGWWQRADGMFSQSLRSRGEFDVSVIAKLYGGGGHKNAAGAQTAEIL